MTETNTYNFQMNYRQDLLKIFEKNCLNAQSNHTYLLSLYEQEKWILDDLEFMGNLIDKLIDDMKCKYYNIEIALKYGKLILWFYNVQPKIKFTKYVDLLGHFIKPQISNNNNYYFFKNFVEIIEIPKEDYFPILYLIISEIIYVKGYQYNEDEIVQAAKLYYEKIKDNLDINFEDKKTMEKLFHLATINTKRNLRDLLLQIIPDLKNIYNN